MLPVALLALARHGAYNMHGSLLPKYRGRVPVNWAVLHGETETGATLHEMAAKPDAGAIIAQTAVPILPDDTAHEVFGKLTVAAEQTLWNALPAILAGQVRRNCRTTCRKAAISAAANRKTAASTGRKRHKRYTTYIAQSPRPIPVRSPFWQKKPTSSARHGWIRLPARIWR